MFWFRLNYSILVFKASNLGYFQSWVENLSLPKSSIKRRSRSHFWAAAITNLLFIESVSSSESSKIDLNFFSKSVLLNLLVWSGWSWVKLTWLVWHETKLNGWRSRNWMTEKQKKMNKDPWLSTFMRERLDCQVSSDRFIKIRTVNLNPLDSNFIESKKWGHQVRHLNKLWTQPLESSISGPISLGRDSP